MSLNGDYNSKESVLSLIQDFLSYVTEEYNSNITLNNILSTSESEEYIERIKSLLEEYFPAELEEKFSELISDIVDEELDDFSDFESGISEVLSEIDRLTYRHGNEIVDGVYLSEVDDVSLSSIWNSGSSKHVSVVSSGPNMKQYLAGFNSAFEGKFVPVMLLDIAKYHSGLEDGTEHYLSDVAKKFETTEDAILDAEYTFECYVKEKFGDNIPTEVEKAREVLRKFIKPLHTVLMNTPIADLFFSNVTYRCLRRAGINTLKDITERTETEIIRVRCMGRRSLNEIVFYLKCHGLKFRSEDEKRLSDRYKKVERMAKAVNITLDVRPPEYSNFTKGGNGFTIYVNVNNNTESPMKLKLQDCFVFSNGRQRASEYNYTGYTFDEEYVLPNIIKTLGKIWITESWTTPKLTKGDVFTISFKDMSNKIYFFKYTFNEHDEWDFDDYYELD